MNKLHPSVFSLIHMVVHAFLNEINEPRAVSSTKVIVLKAEYSLYVLPCLISINP